MLPGYRRPVGWIPAAALAAAVLLVPAVAQMRTGGRAGWTPPFASATPTMLGGIQSLLGTPAGLKLASEIPSLQTVRSYAPTSAADLRALGALGAHLPPDFEARVDAAMRRSRTDPDALASLARTLGDAYQKAVPEVAEVVRARALQVSVMVAHGQIDGRELVSAADELDRFGVYGAGVKEQARIVRHLASQRIMEDAQRIAADFLGRKGSSDDERARSDRDSTQRRDPGGGRKVPESWKLRAYAKAGAAVGARPAASEPEANPMSRGFYERIGASAGMSSAEIEAAYRRTAELYRPERYVDRDARSIIAVTIAFKRVEEAFATLGDPKKRAEYDRGGRVSQGPPSANPLSSDFYERLGATPGMSQADIKAAYRRTAAAYHPDAARTGDEALVKAMTRAFQDIGEAYETLRDPKKRAAYDLQRVKDPPRR